MKTLERIAEFQVWMSGIGLILVTVYISLEVFIRRFAGISLAGPDEIAGYVFGIAATWGFSYTLIRRGHIRIDILYLYASDRTKTICDIAALLSLLITAAAMCYFAFGLTLQSWTRGIRGTSVLGTPLWIPQGLWLLGLLLFAINAAVRLSFVVVLAFYGEHDSLRRIAGTPSSDPDSEIRPDKTSRFIDSG